MFEAGTVLSLALLAGRLAGLARELVLASVFGVSASADVAVLLLTLPDLLVNLLVSGGLSAALVPRLSALGKDDAMVLVRHASVAVALLFGLAGALLVAWPQLVFSLIAPGLHTPFHAGAVAMVAVAIAIPLTGVSGVAGAYLNADRRFFITGCGTLFFNIGVIAALLLALRANDALTVLALGIAAGALLRWVAQLVTFPRGVWGAKAQAPVMDGALMRAFVTAALSSGLLLLAPLVIRAMASTMGTGAIASFNFAQKLVELPVAILITSISTVALTRLSQLHSARDSAGVARVAAHDLRYALLVAFGVAALGHWFADSLVQVVFGHGQMDEQALARVTALTRIALLSVPFIAMSSMASARLNAAGQSARLLKPIGASLLLLPLLALPGLYWSSEQALMWAVVGFQALVACWLARDAGFALTGATAVLNRTLLLYFGAVAALAGLAVGLDLLVRPQQHWVRLGFAGVSFALAWLAMRRFLRADVERQVGAP